MFRKPNCPVIAIEEHYYDQELVQHFGRIEPNPAVVDRMFEFGERRLKEMDEAHIDIQVLSHGAPSAQRLTGDGAIALTQRVNDRLAAVVAARPDRFAAFGALPTCDPPAAADELERIVDKLGFKGAMIHGLANDMFVDHKRFWPIFERAHRLDVPIYLHPSIPHQAVMDVYYKDYAKDFPLVIRAAWGFTVETATQAIRMVLSGIFETYPGLKIIIGHLGEMLPFQVWRIDAALSRPGQKSISFRDVFCGNFHITTSGNFSDPALMCCVQEMGVDRIMFAVDWPFVANTPATQWMQSVPLCDEDKVKILSGNAKRLLRM
jgi:predicted TIM-barrel fold metal-dependent hydrolase